jgi:hypothetical protein
MLSQQTYSPPPEAISSDMKTTLLDTVKRIGTGLALILFPLVFAFCYAIYPGLVILGNPLLPTQMLSDQAAIMQAHGNALFTFGQVLILFDATLLIVITLHFMQLLKRGWVAWAGFIGAAFTVFGAVLLAAEKGAALLMISALNTFPAQMIPGLAAMFPSQGWMVWGIGLIAIGIGIQAIGMIAANVIPRWQSILLLIGISMLGGSGGFEIVSLGAPIFLAVALVPHAIQLLRNQNR